MKTLLRVLAIGCFLSALPSAVLAAPVSASAPGTLSEEQWVMLVYQKGKENYDRGDYENAAAEWDKLAGVVDRYPAFKMVIDYLRGRTKELSPEMADQVEQQLASRKKQIDAAFQKGKDLYDQGKMNEALAEWDKMAQFLPEDAPQRRLIDDLRRYYIQSQQTKETGGLSDQESEEMQRFFASAAELFRTQAQQAQAALEASDSAQKSVDASFAKAKLLYYQGDYTAAMKELQKLAPYFPDGSAERKGIESLTRVYEQSMDEKSGAERAMTQKSVKVKLPPDFNQFSSEVDEKFRAELRESEVRQSSSEKALEDRQAWASADFQKGMELYRAGDVDGAVRQWEAVAPDFENERSVRALIETARKNQAEAARVQREKENALAEKQALLNGRLEKGRLLYEAGNFEEAKKEWNALKELVDDDAKVDAFTSQMQQIYQDSLKVKKAEEEAKAAATARLKTPDSFAAMLSSAQENLKTRQAQADADRARSEAAAAERSALLSKTVSSGKTLIDSGKYSEAFKEWASLLPVVEDEQGLKRTLDALQSDLEAVAKAESEAKDAEMKKNSKAVLPDDLSALLLEAGRQIRAQNDAASARKRQAEQSVVDRQAFVKEHFEKGKLAAEAGKFSDALKEWSGLLPYLEDQAKLKPLLDQAVSDQELLAEAQKGAMDAEARKDQKIKAPGDLAGLLDAASAKLVSARDSARARSDAADKAYAQRQVLVQNTFEKGKSLYDEGRYSEAVKEWSAIVGDLENGEGLRASMKEIEDVYGQSIAAQKTAEESSAKSGAKLPAPAGLSALLIELKQKIQAQTQAQEARKEKADGALAERRAKLDAVFAKGKLALEAGKTEEALAQWSAILPEFEEQARLSQMIDDIKAEVQKLAKTQEEAAAADTRQAGRIPAPPELEKTLSDFFVKMKGETELARSRQERFDGDFENRKTQVRNTYTKGVSLFDEGKYQEALAEWSSILPQLEDEAKLQEMIDRANKDFQNLAIAQKAVFDSEARRTQKLKAPEDLAQHMKTAIDKIKLESVDQFSEILDQEMQAAKVDKEALALQTRKFKAPSDITAELADTRGKMGERTAEAEARRKEAAQALADRQAKLQAEFEKGKKLYWDGKLADAIQVWAALAPQLEDQELQAQITALAKDYENLLAIQKETQESELRRDNKLSAPAELPKMLGDVKQIVQSQTQYADTQKKIADQTFVDRQALINTTFQKGKNLYEQDRIPEALDEWASIAPYLEKGSELKQFIDGVAKNYQDSLLAKRAAEEAQLKRTIKFQTPPDLSRYLEEAGKKMQAQAEDSQMQKEAADRSRSDRQNWVDGKFEHGKLLYQKGDVSGAVEEWKAILPYIEDDSKVRALILKAEENRKTLEAEETAKAAQVPAKIIIPPDLGKAVEAANLELEKSVEKQSRRKLEEDVQGVIQDKKERSSKKTAKKSAPKTPVALDEIEKMMLEYNIATPQELEKRHQEMKAIK